MNWDELKSDWQSAKQPIRQRWPRLTDDDVDHIGGDKELLVALLRERYGLERNLAEQELDGFLATCPRPQTGG